MYGWSIPVIILVIILIIYFTRKQSEPTDEDPLAEIKKTLGSVKFGGVDGYLDVKGAFDNMDTIEDPFTIEFWWNTTGTNANKTYGLVALNKPNGGDLMQLAYYKGKIILVSGSPVGDRTWGIDLPPLKKNDWNHIAITYNNKGMTTIYINGIKQVELERPLDIPPSKALFSIGQEYDSDPIRPSDFAKGFIHGVIVKYGVKYTSNFTPDRNLGYISTYSVMACMHHTDPTYDRMGKSGITIKAHGSQVVAVGKNPISNP